MKDTKSTKVRRKWRYRINSKHEIRNPNIEIRPAATGAGKAGTNTNDINLKRLFHTGTQRTLSQRLLGSVLRQELFPEASFVQSPCLAREGRQPSL